MTVVADSREEAVDKLTEEAKRHLSEVHPDLEKTDEEIRHDVASSLQTIKDEMSPDML
jgi:hypothetical protein